MNFRVGAPRPLSLGDLEWFDATSGAPIATQLTTEILDLRSDCVLATSPSFTVDDGSYDLVFDTVPASGEVVLRQVSGWRSVAVCPGVEPPTSQRTAPSR